VGRFIEKSDKPWLWGGGGIVAGLAIGFAIAHVHTLQEWRWDIIAQPLATLGAGIAAIIAAAIALHNGEKTREQDKKIHEENSRAEQERALRERFTSIVELLATKDLTKRESGAYALAALADDWEKFHKDAPESARREQQVCLNILTSQLRDPIPDKSSSQLSASKEQVQNFKERVQEIIFSRFATRYNNNQRTRIAPRIFLNPTFPHKPGDFPSLDLDLSNCHLHNVKTNGIFSAVNFSNTHFSGITQFSKSVFFGKANFDQAEFDKYAKFDDVKFENISTFKESRFLEEVDFKSASFSSIDFSNSHFKWKANFEDANFKADTSFEKAKFNKEAYFHKANFGGKGNFTEIKFLGSTTFLRAKFYGIMEFRGSEFQEISFNYAAFHKAAHINSVKFHEMAEFYDINFFDVANFSGSKFYKISIFSDSKFCTGALLRDSEFCNAAHFRKAVFYDTPNFANSIFFEKGSFAQAEFHRETSFESADFRKEQDFGGTKFSNLTTKAEKEKIEKIRDKKSAKPIFDVDFSDSKKPDRFPRKDTN
jgi:hypothetical protein